VVNKALTTSPRDSGKQATAQREAARRARPISEVSASTGLTAYSSEDVLRKSEWVKVSGEVSFRDWGGNKSY
jgi:hypothetical protein